MASPDDIADALTKAGVEHLSPAQRAYLARRLAQSEMSDTNLGGLRDVTYGSAKLGRGMASFMNIGAAASALVTVSRRAAPRNWGATGEKELAALGVYPFTIERAKTATPPPELGDIKPLTLGWWPGFGPSDEAQRAFQGLVADWEGFERIGVGSRVFVGERGPDGLTRANLFPDLKDWRAFRDAWKAGDVPSGEIAAQLNVNIENANKVRKYLAEANIIDPSLASNAHDRAGVDAESSTGALAKAAEVDKWAREHPLVNWLTKPGQDTLSPLGFPIPKRVLWIAGGAAAVLLGTAILFRRPSSTVVVSVPRPAVE